MYAADSTEAVPLLTALNVQYGPREELGRYFLRTATVMRDLGIELFLSRDVDRLDRLGKDYEAARPGRFPGMNADIAGFTGENWFTIEGRNKDGRIAFVTAARRLDLLDTLAAEITSLRLLYKNPERQRRSDDVVDITAPSPGRIKGTVALQGAFWVNPIMRGQGLARIFPTLCRWYCRTLWDVHHTIGLFHRDDAERGLPGVYGEPAPERWIKFRGAWNDDSYFTTTSRAMLDQAILAEDKNVGVGGRSTRVKEVLVTKREPSFVVHGNNKRS